MLRSLPFYVVARGKNPGFLCSRLHNTFLYVTVWLFGPRRVLEGVRTTHWQQDRLSRSRLHHLFSRGHSMALRVRAILCETFADITSPSSRTLLPLAIS